MDIFNPKSIIKFKSFFILDKKKRKEFRQKEQQKLKNNNKWGVSYSLFDGEELLEPSILSIRDCVDYINVVYQKESWVGTPATENIEKFLQYLKEKNLIDEIIEYKVDPKEPDSFLQETAKRQIGLEHTVKAGCNYFLPMDVDEFYIKEEVEKAKNYIVDNDITYSYCTQVPYSDHPTKRIVSYIHPCFVMFFSKVNKYSKLVGASVSDAPCLVDKSRLLKRNKKLDNNKNFVQYVFHNVKMHHMTYVRNNLKRKFQNCSTPARRKTSYSAEIDSIFEVEDIFNITKYLSNNETN